MSPSPIEPGLICRSLKIGLIMIFGLELEGFNRIFCGSQCKACQFQGLTDMYGGTGTSVEIRNFLKVLPLEKRNGFQRVKLGNSVKCDCAIHT